MIPQKTRQNKMTREEKIQEAAERLGGVTEWKGRQGYLAEEVDEFFFITDDDLVALSDMMYSDDEDTARDAYSQWCASYGERAPAEEQQAIRDYCDA